MNNPLLSRLNQEELLVDPSRKDWFESCLHGIMSHANSDKFLQSMSDLAANNDDGFWPAPDDWKAQYRPYIVKNGVLQIPVFGVLLNRFSFQVGSWATGYTYILRCFLRGMEDPEVKGIAFICETPGGVVAGNFELVDKMFEYRGVKPMMAFAAEYAYSAGYSIASVADKISVTRTGGVGSIGVVTAHVDYSSAMEKAGIKVTFIYAGDYKVEGNAYEKLPAGAKARIQARIDKLYAIFTSTVARNRAMDEEKVIATKALTYTGEDAIEVGLADQVGIFEESLGAFTRSLNDNDDGGEEDENMATYTQEQFDKAVADARTETAASNTSAVSAARTEGMAAAMTRFSAIVNSEEGKKRPKAAMSLATKTSMAGVSAEDIVATLADMPEEQAVTEPKKPEGQQDQGSQQRNHFNDAMSKDNPNVGGGNAEGGDGDGKGDEAVNPLLADYGKATGLTFGKKNKAA